MSRPDRSLSDSERKERADIAFNEAVQQAQDIRDAANMATAREYEMAINAANAAYLKATTGD